MLFVSTSRTARAINRPRTRNASTTSARRRRSGCAAERNRQALQRPVVFVEKTCAEIGSAAAVDDSGTNHVAALAQRQALRHAVVDHGLPVVVERDDSRAVEPP